MVKAGFVVVLRNFGVMPNHKYQLLFVMCYC